MKKFKNLCLVILLFLATSLFACGGSKSVNLTLLNYEDYLNVSATTSNYQHAIHIRVASRNSDYVFENCKVTVNIKLYRQTGAGSGFDYFNEEVEIPVNRNGSGYKDIDYESPFNKYVESYGVVLVLGKVSKNPLS